MDLCFELVTQIMGAGSEERCVPSMKRTASGISMSVTFLRFADGTEKPGGGVVTL